ncbi:hypothetical protein LT709_23485 [Pseudomonas syringae pv. syringae]|jgi:hypothetical protein|uniref:hypothetical protein n=1 Tax=Pseudomonas syringae TaxID=317 RepID=UPI002009E92D|nr:hypothetical protein [Pseudomonas syringae]MCK9704431.1 hypothetical protein [Pseudomonas syringae pv. syringae]MCK9759550.1 hypothetical protein [Pseudomonas syringae pv. syringae]MCK9774660.1 hypothetical protein [Pseudomonas syringae pv. syringae]MDU8417485.1 hypothetical protein [Pseudomonas syringae]
MTKLKREHNYGYLNFFEIERSGLYKLQKKNSGEELISKVYGLKTAEVFRSLQTWISGRALKETCPWPSKGDSETESVMCYCREIKEFPNGDFMVVLWKYDPADKKGFRGLELDTHGNPTGNYITNGASNTGENYLWGHPCYYWIVPEKSMVVSIKFDDSKCDSDLMQKWVNYCVRFRLKFLEYNSRSTGEHETRISFSSPAHPETYDLLYRFKTNIKIFKTTEEHLQKICEATKFMLLRNEVTVSDGAKDTEMKAEISALDGLDQANVQIFNYFQGLIEKFFPKAKADDDNIRKVEIKLEATPSLEQIKELMAYSSGFIEGGWADIIFVDELDNRTSIKTHRIVERVVLQPTLESYTCDQLFQVLSDARSNYTPLTDKQVDSNLPDPQAGTGQ